MLFKERTTTPGKDNKCYYSNENPFYRDGYGMPNCTAYAWGRWFELLGKKPNLCINQAEKWYLKDDGYARGKTPKLGAIACWRKGDENNWKDGSGHVAPVERINQDGSFMTSESAWQGYTFRNNIYRGNYNFGEYVFQGFIYIPIEFEVPRATLSIDEIARQVINGVFGNGQDRVNRLTSAGYNYNEVQNRVNEILKGNVTPKKSIDEIAKEVIKGKFGNGQDRVNRLTQAGYNYNEVQNRVNQMLR